MLAPRDPDFIGDYIKTEERIRRLETRKQPSGGGLVAGVTPDQRLEFYLPSWWGDNYGDAAFWTWNGRVWFRGAIIVQPGDAISQYATILPSTGSPVTGTPDPLGRPLPEEVRPSVPVHAPIFTAGANDGATYRIMWVTTIGTDGSWTITSRGAPPHLPDALNDPQIHLSQVSYRRG